MQYKGYMPRGQKWMCTEGCIHIAVSLRDHWGDLDHAVCWCSYSRRVNVTTDPAPYHVNTAFVCLPCCVGATAIITILRPQIWGFDWCMLVGFCLRELTDLASRTRMQWLGNAFVSHNAILFRGSHSEMTKSIKVSRVLIKHGMGIHHVHIGGLCRSQNQSFKNKGSVGRWYPDSFIILPQIRTPHYIHYMLIFMLFYSGVFFYKLCLWVTRYF